MARIVIPTRNRPVSLSSVLGYFERFYPETELIIADGSTSIYHDELKQVLDETNLSVEYHQYPSDLGLFQRLTDVLNKYDDPYFIMGSDDDYPKLEVLKPGEAFLDANPDYVTWIGSSVNLHLLDDDVYTVQFDHSRSIAGPTALQRMRNYAKWPFPTTYALTRRNVLIDRYTKLAEYVHSLFVDFMIGCYETGIGKIKAAPDVGFICTRNYNHSYLRGDRRLQFLSDGPQVMQIMESFASVIALRDGVEIEKARDHGEGLIKLKLQELCGIRPYDRRGFSQLPMYKDARVQAQLGQFDDLFTEGSDYRAQHIERLNYINQAVHKNVRSTDNRGESWAQSNLGY